MTEIFFLTNVFKDGSFLGFWSHSPWGRVHDMEQGWAIFSPDLELLDSFTTKTLGTRKSGFREWRKEKTILHGKSFRLMPEWGGDQFWKITE